MLGARSSNWRGFFISRCGYALTSSHNLPHALANTHAGKVEAHLRDGRMAVLDYVHMPGDEDRDIALLKRDGATRAPLPFLVPGTLRSSASEAARIDFWRGRQVLVAGFPFGDRGQSEDFIHGHIPYDAPLGIDDEKDCGGIRKEAERLRIRADRYMNLQGISGGPVVDCQTGWVVGVQGGCDERRGLALATELRRADPEWPSYVQRLFRRLPSKTKNESAGKRDKQRPGALDYLCIGDIDEYSPKERAELLAAIVHLGRVRGGIQVTTR